ncbi:lysophospholipid acyltransferase family protein [Occallatibacter savannae]|uniref:lysophospholipid acyltransferase family protein n=1 Tax=Occallatibacter savannae TaxID=1002691 RepID=UPI000D6962D6|nr:lysophospholipid acyltransferase family protein [Occallatibacter savannae]
MTYSLLLIAWIVILGIPAAIICLPWAILTGNVQPLYRASTFIVRTGYALARINVQVSGRELIPAKMACIFMANHVSNLDPPALLPNIPGRVSAFIKESLIRIPVFGLGLKLAEFIPVERSGDRESAADSVAAARQILVKGIHIMTFVEGTRSPDGRMLPFKKGPFYLAKETGAPCIPVSIWGTETMMAKGSVRIRPGTAHVIFHPPINPGDYETREELMGAVRAAIASGLPEWMRS